MTDPTLLQQARDHFEASLRQPEARRRQLERVAFELLLQHLEQREAATRGPAQVPGEPSVRRLVGKWLVRDDPAAPKCKVCGSAMGYGAHAEGLCSHPFAPDENSGPGMGVEPNVYVAPPVIQRPEPRQTLAHDVGSDLDLDLDELQRLCDAATPGPWLHDTDGDILIGGTPQPYLVGCLYAADDGDRVRRDAADVTFIAAARDALPKLIARVRELEAKR